MKRARFTSYRPCLEEFEPRLTMSGPGANTPDVLPGDHSALAARWWQWAFSIPLSENPLSGDSNFNIATGQSGDVWFLAGVGFSSVTRTGTIPEGTALFFPIVNFENDTVCTSPPGTTVDQMRADAKAAIDGATNLQADVDGRPIQGLQRFRQQSPVFSVTVPKKNLFQVFGCDVRAGTYSPFVDDGYYVLLAPLSEGQHTIHFHAEVPAFGFTLDATYILTVVEGEGAASTTNLASAASALSAPGKTASAAQVPPPAQAHAHGTAARDQVFAGLVPPAVAAPGTTVGATSVPHSEFAQAHGATALDQAFAAPWGNAPFGAL